MRLGGGRSPAEATSGSCVSQAGLATPFAHSGSASVALRLNHPNIDCRLSHRLSGAAVPKAP